MMLNIQVDDDGVMKIADDVFAAAVNKLRQLHGGVDNIGFAAPFADLVVKYIGGENEPNSVRWGHNKFGGAFVEAFHQGSGELTQFSITPDDEILARVDDMSAIWFEPEDVPKWVR